VKALPGRPAPRRSVGSVTGRGSGSGSLGSVPLWVFPGGPGALFVAGIIATHQWGFLAAAVVTTLAACGLVTWIYRRDDTEVRAAMAAGWEAERKANAEWLANLPSSSGGKARVVAVEVVEVEPEILPVPLEISSAILRPSAILGELVEPRRP
jgi:hypothetical protein